MRSTLVKIGNVLLGAVVLLAIIGSLVREKNIDAGLPVQIEVSGTTKIEGGKDEEEAAPSILDAAESMPAVEFESTTLNTEAVDPDEVLFNTVIKVIDGDTVAVSMNGVSEIVRLIGVDTPETVDPRTTVQCFGKEASEMTMQLLSGKRVSLEFDATQGVRDKYNRLLAYVFREDGLFVNQYLIENGYAHEYTYSIPYTYQSAFVAAERAAQIGDRGLWAPGICDQPDPEPAPVTPVSAPTPVPDTSGYVCAYNAYNCGDFSTHTQAQSVYEMCGGPATDVHRLDNDKDGIACESLP